MDMTLPIAVFMILLLLFLICGWCCKRKREGMVYGSDGGTGVTVSTQPISASPVVVPPYPVDPRHPTPHSGAPGIGFAPQTAPYPTMPAYPPAPGAAPYPPMSHGAPYPPASAGYSQPPPYDVAVSQPPIHPPPPVHEGYGKQSPYNPDFPKM